MNFSYKWSDFSSDFTEKDCMTVHAAVNKENDIGLSFVLKRDLERRIVHCRMGDDCLMQYSGREFGYSSKN